MTKPTETELLARPKVIEVEDLVTHYGERMILKGISMDVREGEIMVIMGGSGSGKSTLLRHLMSLEHATSGTMKLLGNNIADLGLKDTYALRKKNRCGLSRRRFIQFHDCW